MAKNAPKILFIKSKSFIYLLTSILVSILMLCYLFIITNNTNYYSKEGVVLGNYKQIEELKFPANSSLDIEQEISSLLNDIGKITLTLNTNTKTFFYLKLINKQTNEIIRQESLVTQHPGNNIELLEWEFKPISNSENKDYLLQINSLIDSDIIFYTVEPDRYDGGNLIIDETTNNDSRLIIDWEYYTSNPVQKIYHYLPFFKPWIFNHSITYIILTILLFIFQTLLIWQVLKIFYKKNEL